MSRRKSWKKLFGSVIATVLIGSAALPLAPTSVYADRGVVDLWKSIKPLTTIASAMNTGAHPDDEHSATLAYLSLGKGVDTYSLIANRGEGGQNEIGSELGNALGIIRTHELQEASKLTNVTLGILSEKINDPIFDFGFSKSPDETLTKWGESVVYERLIRKIRELQPDVVIPSFLNEPSTHGHHRAINVITVKAYKDAADPNVFPEQIKQGLLPWQIKKLYVPASEKDFTVKVPIGDYDETYGASYVQLGEESRFMHKSQGMGRHYDEGPSYNYYKLENATVLLKSKESDLFAGIAFTFDDLAKEVSRKAGGQEIAKGISSLQKDSAEVIAAYPSFPRVAKEVHEMKKDLLAVMKMTRASRLDELTKADLLHRFAVKQKQLDRASQEATSFIAKIKPETNELVAGQTTKITVTAYNGGHVPLKNVNLQPNVPKTWKFKALNPSRFAELGYNQTVSTTFEVSVPPDQPLFQPYEKPTVSAMVTYDAFGTQTQVQVIPSNAVAVLPAFSLTLNPNATVLNTLNPQAPIPVKATVRNYNAGAVEAEVSLNVPQGWSVEPKAESINFAAKGETKSISFTVKPSASVKQGKYTVEAVAVSSVGNSTNSVQVIEYPHIGRTYFVQPADLSIQAFDLKVPTGLKVGYVSSGFDNIDQYLEQLGVNVTRLSAKDIESADLSQFDTIVLGIRAYAFRSELIPSNARLLKYVENGGNLVVQYHKPEDKWKPELAPYPITIGQPLIEWRVTDENSKVTTLAPDHPIFNQPNKISEHDWNNWIQDRSAYNPSVWSKEYVELISNGDPGEKEFTGTFLSAKYGKGTYTYSSLVWYREIPALVPGAIRLFVNMISLKQ